MAGNCNVEIEWKGAKWLIVSGGSLDCRHSWVDVIMYV